MSPSSLQRTLWASASLKGTRQNTYEFLSSRLHPRPDVPFDATWTTLMLNARTWMLSRDMLLVVCRYVSIYLCSWCHGSNHRYVHAGSHIGKYRHLGSGTSSCTSWVSCGRSSIGAWCRKLHCARQLMCRLQLKQPGVDYRWG